MVWLSGARVTTREGPRRHWRVPSSAEPRGRDQRPPAADAEVRGPSPTDPTVVFRTAGANSTVTLTMECQMTYARSAILKTLALHGTVQ